MTDATRGYPDLHEHLDALQRAGLAADDRRADRQGCGAASAGALAIRRRHRGGRRARRSCSPTSSTAAAASMRCRSWSARSRRTARSTASAWACRSKKSRPSGTTRSRIRCRRASSTNAPCHEVVLEGDALQGEGNGLDTLPIPISTPGFDSAPTLTATNVITRDPETGVQNMGTYRAALKAPDRLGRAHGDARRRRRRLSALSQAPAARRQDDAVRDRARLPAVRRLHGAAEAADRRR